MKHLLAQRHIVKQNFLSLLCFCLVCYFGYHALMGERSVMRLMALERKMETVSATYDVRKAEREALESHVSRLRPGSIDPDLLEERARFVLGYTRDDEQIILMAN